MHGDGLLQLIGQIPALGQPAADFGVSYAKDLFLGVADVEILCASAAGPRRILLGSTG